MEEKAVLEEAIEAWIAHRPRGNQQPQVEACQRLAQHGVFSNAQLAAITGLSKDRVGTITRKRDHTGGRLAVHTMPLMLRLQVDYANGVRNERLLKTILSQGTSQRTVARLTGIHVKAIERMAA